jgi:peptide/nickel transport system permease protein
MWRYLVRRSAWAAAVFVAVTLATYVTFFVVAERTPQSVQGRGSLVRDTGRDAHLRQLNDPVVVQYARYLRQLAGGSLGRADSSRRSVNDVVLRAVPVTASLIIGAVAIWLTIALVVGIHSALRPRSLLDRLAMIFVLIGISSHPVWIGLIFAYFVGFKAGLTPITGYCDFWNPSGECGGPTQWAYHLVLPWITFAILFAATYVRFIRANVMETLNEDYVRTAKAKGAPPWIVMRSHVLRNAMLPVVTILGLDIGLALGGAVFTETVYGLPGLGKTAIQAIDNFDLPTVQGVVVFATTVIIIVNLVVDTMYAWIDPRIRLT